MTTIRNDTPRDRRRDAGAHDASCRTPTSRSSDERRRGGRGRAALRLADDRPARPGLRGRSRRGDRGAPRRGVQLGDRGAPWRRRGGRSRTGRRGDHHADDLRRDAPTPSCTPAPTPRFADVDPGTLLIDPDAVAAAITPRTQAILPVDYAGQPADYDALRAIADAAPGGRADDHRRRVALARGDARRAAGRDARRHDRAEPPPGQDPDDRRRRRGPDRSRRARRPRCAASATTASRPSSPPAATGPTRWSSSATTTG